MLRKSILFFLTTLLAAALTHAQLAAQDKKHPSAPVERKLITDDKGMQQWAPYKAAPCLLCKQTKQHECRTCKDAEHAKECLECGNKKNPRTMKSPCRLCAGEGKMPDALVEAPCMGCYGSGVFACDGCGGNQTYTVQGGGKGRLKCPTCKGKGAIPCTVCKGKRRCAALSIRKGIEGASLKDLRKAEAVLTELRDEMRSWVPAGVKPRVELKLHQARLKKLSKIAKDAKKASSMIKAILAAVARKDMYVGSEDRKARAFTRFAQYNAFYIDHQLQAVKIAIGRAEHNEAVAKEAKGK